MNIGVIVYSETGNTLSVAKKLEQALKTAGHAVTLAKIEADRDPKTGVVTFKSKPAIDAYDTVIFASPVQAFSLARPMKLYLDQISALSGKKAACFVTQGLKKDWMGGSHAIRQIKSACKVKGADIALTGIVHWSCADHDVQIDEVVQKLSAI
ncbi:MAG TPA: NAD(P)H-dependent oxidoreductase [Oscillospiraceae bacterium]|mgnify:CR=1 FL=1|nr:NAD(P)H-dependent oxidoreductase [Oscillospiraceae bacterium]HPK35945.1 NAD(P)H-dependent oxidoreductase [Oscillospiraceae bacterium]HPR75638.1 NAD(P)H-dependent oxidoreductase [Oscillospiraceae bacterium]